MTTVALTNRDRRTLGVGALAISVMLLGSRGLPALRAWSADRLERARAAADELASARATIAVLPALRDSVRARRDRLALLDSALLSGSTPAAIGAMLASVVERIASENAMKVTALQLRADSVAVASLARAEVRVTAIGDVVGLAGFLAEVDGGAMYLVARDVSVSQPEPAASDARPEMLHVDVTIAGIGTVHGASVSEHP